MSTTRLEIEINGHFFASPNSSKNYVDAFRYLYKQGYLKEQLAIQDFTFIRKNEFDLKRSARAINDNKTMWVSVYSDNRLKKKQIDSVLKKYFIDGHTKLIVESDEYKNAKEELGKLRFYISYDYLPVEQYSKIIQTVNNMYENISELLIPELKSYGFNNGRSFPFPLCLEEVKTGSSISTKFSFSEKLLPEFKITDGEIIHIILPKWTAILVLSGMVLTYGVDKYKDYLDIRLKQMEIEEKSREVILNHSNLLQQTVLDNEKKNLIESNIIIFNSQIQQSNIRSVYINGTEIENRQNIQN